METKYGLWDTKNKSWMGNGDKSKGPCLYDDFKQAGAAATIAAKMLGMRRGGILPRIFPVQAELVYVGEEQAQCTCDEAIEQLEKEGK